MNQTERYKIKVAVYGVLIEEGKVLLTRRANAEWQNGMWGLPAGHLEEGESISEGLMREVKEEIGVELKPEDFELVFTMHRPDEYIDLFFIAKSWQGEPKNMEPEKCDGVEWFSLADLPANTIASVRHALSSYKKGEKFTEFLEKEW